jgi:uncharacterized protein (TIRG00374 family)
MPIKHGKDLQRRLMRPLLWSVLAAMAIYGGSVIVSDFNAVSESVLQLGFTGWAIVLGLSLANYVLRFARWEVYLGYLNCRIDPLQSLAYYIGGFAFTTSPGKAGEAVRSLYLKRHGVAYVHSLAAFFTERFVDLVAMVLLALVAALAFPEHQWPVLIITVLVIAALTLIHAKSVHALLDRHVEKLRSKKIRSAGKRFLDMLNSASTLLRSGPLFVGLVLALIAWGAEGIAFHLILASLGVGTSIGLAVGIYSVSVLAGALSFIPGGLGSTEAVMVLLLKLVGADTATAVAATLICRLATLWFAVFIGVIVLTILESSDKAGQGRAPTV